MNEWMNDVICDYLFLHSNVFWSPRVTAYTSCPVKKGPTVYFGRNFDKFRQLFIIFGTNHPDNPCDWKIVKMSHRYLHDSDVIEKCRFRKKRNARIHSASTVASKFAGFKFSWLKCLGNAAKQGVQNIHDLSRRPSTVELSGLDHAVIAAAAHQSRRNLSSCIMAGSGHFEHCLWFRHCVCSNNCVVATFLAVVDQLNSCTLIGRFGLITAVSWLCALQYVTIVSFAR